jgi:antitoxin component of RelBE/YafQ-DinJ toxin-antitoxin module
MENNKKASGIFKEIRNKLSKNNTNQEIIGEPDYKQLSNKDLIPLSSIFDDFGNTSVGKEVAKHLNNIINTFDREDRYERYRIATKMSEADGSLDIYASECATQDEKGNVLNVFSSNAKVKKIVTDVFERIGLEDKSYEIIKNMCTYGDEFWENVYSANGKGIAKITPVPREIIGRYEENGVLKNFFLRNTKANKTNKDSYYSYDYTYQKKEENPTIEPFRILHWKIPSSEYAPYGKSILEPVITPLEELRLLEQSLLIARISRAPERRLYYVNVGDAAGEKGIALAREIVKGLKRKSILDKGNGSKLESNVDFFGASEDVVVPFRRDEERSTIESLPQLNDPGQLQDLEFIRDRIFPGLGIPRQYLFDDTFANANTNLSNKSVQFAKRIRRIQKYFLYQVYKIAYIELKLRGVNQKDYTDLLITMNNPSNVDIREKLETESNKWNLISSMKSMNAEKVFYNDFYIYQQVLGLNYEEVLQLMVQNIAQEKSINPFNFIPEDKRPLDYQMVDQLRSEGEEGAPTEGEKGAEGDENNNGIPDEAEEAFGPPPEEGEEEVEGNEGEVAEPIEGEEGATEEPTVGEEGTDETDALFDSQQIKTKRAQLYFEAIRRGKEFSEKKLERLQKRLDEQVSKDSVRNNPKYTVPIYTEDYLQFNSEFDGLKISNKVIQL